MTEHEHQSRHGSRRASEVFGLDPLPRFQCEPIDLGALLDDEGGDTACVDELIGLFLTDIGERIRELAGALQLGQLGPVQQFASSLEGESRTVHAEPIRSLAEHIERAARRGDLLSIPRLLVDLLKESDRARLFIAERGPLSP